MSGTLKHPCDEEFIRSTRTEVPCARKAGPWVLAATILGSTAVALASALGAALLIEGKKKPEEKTGESKFLAA